MSKPLRYSKGAASAVRHGHGEHTIDQQARHFTAAALQKIAHLMGAQKTRLLKTDSGYETHTEDDTRLQFMAARFLLELGWGRSPLRATSASADETMTPEEQQRLQQFLEEFKRDTAKNDRIQSDTAPHPAPLNHRAVDGGAGAAGMANHRTAEPTDACG